MKIKDKKVVIPYSVLASLKGNEFAVLDYLLAQQKRTRRSRRRSRLLELQISDSVIRGEG